METTHLNRLVAVSSLMKHWYICLRMVLTHNPSGEIIGQSEDCEVWYIFHRKRMSAYCYNSWSFYKKLLPFSEIFVLKTKYQTSSIPRQFFTFCILGVLPISNISELSAKFFEVIWICNKLLFRQLKTWLIFPRSLTEVSARFRLEYHKHEP